MKKKQNKGEKYSYSVSPKTVPCVPFTVVST